jgi:hypothetical protein
MPIMVAGMLDMHALLPRETVISACTPCRHAVEGSHACMLGWPAYPVMVAYMNGMKENTPVASMPAMPMARNDHVPSTWTMAWWLTWRLWSRVSCKINDIQGYS